MGPLLVLFLDSSADRQTGAKLSRAVSAVLTTAMVVTNLIGVAVVLAVRPASRALAEEDPGRLRVPGVGTRAMLAWAFGSEVPILGVVTVGIATLAGFPATEAQLERVMVAPGIGLNSGQVVAGNLGGGGRLKYGVTLRGRSEPIALYGF